MLGAAALVAVAWQAHPVIRSRSRLRGLPRAESSPATHHPTSGDRPHCDACRYERERAKLASRTVQSDGAGKRRGIRRYSEAPSWQCPCPFPVSQGFPLSAVGEEANVARLRSVARPREIAGPSAPDHPSFPPPTREVASTRMRSRRLSSSTGFATCSSKPAPRADSRSSRLANPVIAMASVLWLPPSS
jgi:hypothetical protein